MFHIRAIRFCLQLPCRQKRKIIFLTFHKMFILTGYSSSQTCTKHKISFNMQLYLKVMHFTVTRYTAKIELQHTLIVPNRTACCTAHLARCGQLSVESVLQSLSALYAISLKMPQNDAQLQFYCAHSLCMKPVSVCSTVNEVRRAKLRASANKHLGQLFLPGSHWPPCHTLQPVLSGTGGHMAVAVTVQLTPAKRVLVPDLYMQLWPT